MKAIVIVGRKDIIRKAKKMKKKKILIVISNEDFDPTETAVPWKSLKKEGHEVIFATPNGQRGHTRPNHGNRQRSFYF